MERTGDSDAFIPLLIPKQEDREEVSMGQGSKHARACRVSRVYSKSLFRMSKEGRDVYLLHEFFTL